MIYLELLWSFFQVGLCSFGGGYAAMPIIETQVVDINGWMTKAEFFDIISISQIAPGSVAVNSATFVGGKVAGGLGAAVATFGCILPSCLIVILLAFFYQKYKNIGVVSGVLEGIRPAAVAVVASAAISVILLTFLPTGVFALSAVDFLAVALFALCLTAQRFFKKNPIFVIIGGGFAGLIIKGMIW